MKTLLSIIFILTSSISHSAGTDSGGSSSSNADSSSSSASTNNVDVNIELIEFESLLNHLGINKDQLVCLGILVGTDFNPGGVKGIGQKTALEIVRKWQYPVKIFEYIDKSEKYSLNFDWQAVYREFKEYDNLKDVELDFKKPDKDKIKKILSDRDFSENRISSGLNKLEKAREAGQQRTLF